MKLFEYLQEKENLDVFQSFDLQKFISGDLPLSLLMKRVNCNSYQCLLLKAIEYNWHEISKKILEEKLNKINKNEALLTACLYNREFIGSLLILNGANVNTINNNGDTPLHILCAERDQYNLDFIKKIIKYGANVNAQNIKGETPLHIAYAGNDKLKIKILLDNGADIIIKDNKGNTPLDFQNKL